MTTKLHSTVMIAGIIATGLVSIITALQAGGFDVGTVVGTLLPILIFLEHIANGNTPSNATTPAA